MSVKRKPVSVFHPFSFVESPCFSSSTPLGLLPTSCTSPIRSSVPAWPASGPSALDAPAPCPVLCAPCAVVSGLQFPSWGPCVQASLTDHPEGGSWTEVTCSWFVKAFFSSEGLYWHSCLPAFEIFFFLGQKWELGISSWKATVNSGVLVETHSSSRCICVCC